MRNPNEIDQAVSRTLRDSLDKLQRTAEELNQAINDLVSACASSRPSNSLPPMLRAQTAASSLSGSLEVLSRFVIAALQPVPGFSADQQSVIAAAAAAVVSHVAEPEADSAPAIHPAALPETQPISPELSPESSEQTWSASAPAPAISEAMMESQPAETQSELRSSDMVEEGAPVAEPIPAVSEPVHDLPELDAAQAEREVAPETEIVLSDTEAVLQSSHQETFPDLPASNPVPESVHSFDALEVASFSEPVADSEAHADAATVPAFDVSALRQEERDLHRRADRVAKVAMQDIKMLHPEDVKLGKENHDLCARLRDDIERARREYDRRFHSILDHPVDYFYNRMVEILGDGKPETLGDYPYPTPVLRR